MANGENIHLIARGILKDYGLKQIDRLRPGEAQETGITSFVQSRLSMQDILGVVDLVCVGLAASVENKSYGSDILVQTKEYLYTSHYTEEPIIKSITPHTACQNERPDHNLQKLRKKLMDVRKLNELLTEENRREIFGEEKPAVLQFMEYIGTQQ